MAIDAPITADSFAPPSELRGLQGRFLIAGVVGLVVAALGFVVDRPHFFQSWLVAWVLWLSVALGCLGLAMLHHLSRGAWGLMIRRPLEAGARTLPLLLLLFVPVLLGMHDLFEWSRDEVVRHDQVLQQKAPYLNVPFFIGRALFYFLIWIALAWSLTQLSRRQDETGDPAIFRRLQAISAAGFLLLALTGSFASIDWLMSLDPHWQSSLFGLWFFAGLGLSGLVFAVVVANWLRRHAPMAGVLRPQHFHDYGKLFFAFTMLWAYLSFSQFLLIWAGNLPEEIPFYLRRAHGGWGLVSALLVIGHFFLPFLILLSADVKRRGAMLVKVAIWMLFMRWLDYFWHVAPTLQAVRHGAGDRGSGLAGLWIDLAALVGIGGIFVWFYLGQLAARSLLPVKDPFLAEVLAHE
ncbi:MAG TPA: hypothetical protein VGS57_01915 [Thermoanaerobaculia bacterium]|jgi:hypothetical protein|nr:hypothetical protein [Thermoanaerobaculia bacterium]